MDHLLIAGLSGLQTSPLLPLLLLGMMSQQQRPSVTPQPQPSQLQQAAQQAADAYVRAVSAFESAQASADAALRTAAQPQWGLQPGMAGMPNPLVQPDGNSTLHHAALASFGSTMDAKPDEVAPVQKKVSACQEEKIDTEAQVKAHNEKEMQLQKDRENYQREARDQVRRSDARVAAQRQQEEKKTTQEKPIMQPKPKKRPLQDISKKDHYVPETPPPEKPILVCQIVCC